MRLTKAIPMGKTPYSIRSFAHAASPAARSYTGSQPILSNLESLRSIRPVEPAPIPSKENIEYIEITQ